MDHHAVSICYGCITAINGETRNVPILAKNDYLTVEVLRVVQYSYFSTKNKCSLVIRYPFDHFQVASTVDI